MRTMITPRYIWERRKVVSRVLKNWLLRIAYEPFRPGGSINDTAVVFVRQNARGRVFNHGYVLSKNEGVRTILLTRVFDYMYHREAFDEIIVFYNKIDLENKIKKLSQRYNLLAVIGSTQPAWPTRVLIEMHRIWPVLIDQYDSIWACCYFAQIDPTEKYGMASLAQEIPDEEYCFRNADGIIARSGELPILLEEHEISTSYILIEDGVNPVFFQPMAPSPSPKKGEWSIVYAGLIVPMNLNARDHGVNQFVPQGKLFAQEKIHFHLYPSPHHNYQYPEYEAEAARNPYFHIHASVDFDNIHREISQYDFGWLAIDSPQYTFWSETYGRHLITNKQFTYLEAGLPIITNAYTARIAETVKMTGAGFVMGNQAPVGTRAAIGQQNMTELISGVARARHELDMNNKSHELITFIRELSRPYESKQL